MLKTRHRAADMVVIELDGETVRVPAGLSVAAAVLSVSDTATRTTPVTGAGRAPYCMMGICFECLMEIDGLPNRQACMVPVADDMKVARQLGARKLESGK